MESVASDFNIEASLLVLMDTAWMLMPCDLRNQSTTCKLACLVQPGTFMLLHRLQAMSRTRLQQIYMLLAQSISIQSVILLLYGTSIDSLPVQSNQLLPLAFSILLQLSV